MNLLKAFESDVEKLGGKIYSGLKDVGYDILSTFTRPEETVSWTAVPPLSKKPLLSERYLSGYAEYMHKRNIQAGRQEAKTLSKTYATSKAEAQRMMKLAKPIVAGELEKKVKWIPFSKQIISSTLKTYPYEYAAYKTINKLQQQIQKSASKITPSHFLGAIMGLTVGTPLIVKTLSDMHKTSSASSTGEGVYSALVSFMPMMVVMFMFMMMFSMFKDFGSMF